MYRLDKIDVQLVHVVPAVDRFGAAAGSDPGATPVLRAHRNRLFPCSSSGEALPIQAKAHSGTICLLAHIVCSPQSDANIRQCIAFTRWKQHRFSEAMDGFLQVSHARLFAN